MENINMNEQRGKELEINCLGTINHIKYKKELAKVMELIEIYKYIIIGKKRKKSTNNWVNFDFNKISMKDIEKEIIDLKERSPESYEKIREEIKEKVIKKIDDKMKHKNKYLDVPIEEQLRIVRESQRHKNDIFEPYMDFASDLHANVAQELSPEDYSNLEYYTSVDSHLDHSAGIDGFFNFKYKNEKGKSDQITIPFDICSKDEAFKEADRHKKDPIISESLTGDVIIFDMDQKEDYNRKNEEDKKLMKIFTNKVIKEIKKQIKEKGDKNEEAE